MEKLKKVAYSIFLNQKLELIGFMINKSNSYNLEYNKFFGFKEVVGNFKEIRQLKNFAKKNAISCRVYVSNIGKEESAYQYADVLRYLKQEEGSSIFVCLEYDKNKDFEDNLQKYDVNNFILSEKKDSMNIVYQTLLCIKGLN